MTKHVHSLLSTLVIGLTMLPILLFAQAKNEMQMNLPVGGNTWQMEEIQGSNDLISNEGIHNWTNKEARFKTFFRVSKTGTVKLWMNAASPSGKSTIGVKIGDQSAKVQLQNKEFEIVYIGEWLITDTGYVAIELEGLTREGLSFPKITDYKIAGTAVNEDTRFVKNNEGNFFYWGRRGPSVHLRYPVPKDMNAKWYYNEITVPEGEDIIGSYYMANGFDGGYFGIQVNSETERRVLFSVWSPFVTDNPDDIPEEQKIKLLKKGKDVNTGEFGNEGSGGQSFLRYDWKAGNTYKFLLKGEPVGNNHTEYSAWFFAPEEGHWRLIASFSRPKTNSWLTGFHSFLENFNPNQGVFARKALFSNQWVADNENKWTELNEAVFSADNTARSGFRVDYAGGEQDNQFYLKNCGFFDDYTPVGVTFTRPLQKEIPKVSFDKLP